MRELMSRMKILIRAPTSSSPPPFYAIMRAEKLISEVIEHKVYKRTYADGVFPSRVCVDVLTKPHKGSLSPLIGSRKHTGGGGGAFI